MVPLAEMFGYATDLRSATQGRGVFTMEFDHYARVSESVARTIIGGVIISQRSDCCDKSSEEGD